MADSQQSPPMTDSQQSPPKADSQPLAAPLTGSLRSDIVLFSTLLSSKQSDSSESHPNDANLTLFVDISTLLAIGSAHSPQAQNVNAVLGKITQTGVEEIAMEFLVCAENAKQEETQVKALREQLRGDPLPSGKGKGMSSPMKSVGVGGGSTGCMGAPTESAPITGEKEEDSTKSGEKIWQLDPIIPKAEDGRKLLDQWAIGEPDQENVKTVKWVIHLSIEWLTYMTLSNFTFREHLQDLFDVVTSLRHGDASDLLLFQHFISHRAYRKLGWRVLEFSTHWGKSPFDIISDHLVDLNSEPASFQFPCQSSLFHQMIRHFVTPKSMTEQEPDYPLNSDNAPQWLELFQSAWNILQSELLVENSKGKNDMTVRTDSPSTKSVQNIVVMTLILEDLLDVLIHLLSADGAAQALASAGKLESSYTSGCCAHAFPEVATYLKKFGISDPSAIESNTMLDENEADDMELELGLPPVSCESCHLQCSSLCVTSIVQF